MKILRISNLESESQLKSKWDSKVRMTYLKICCVIIGYQILKLIFFCKYWINVCILWAVNCESSDLRILRFVDSIDLGRISNRNLNENILSRFSNLESKSLKMINPNPNLDFYQFPDSKIRVPKFKIRKSLVFNCCSVWHSFM